ncbi:PepSY-associated TM helix domain-containing protein [Saccharopolyspora sp. CA-218241]|uniref:PepSY-associated TM helix domain-containing protein n=1 Tax=Saccharopolyspora sp. CA-218241 TaxID=3240027 RepID=UPI003D95122F
MAVEDPVDLRAEQEDVRRRGSTWSALRPLVLRLHFYAGVFIAPFLVIAALSGMLYVFTPQLDEVVYDHELHVAAATEPARPLDEQIAAARAARPGDELMAVRPAPTATDTTQVIFEAPDLPASYRRTAFVDPYTADVRGVLETYGSGQALPIRAWVDNLHRGLHLGDAGRLYSELAASWMWVVALGGIALWIGRRRRNRRSLVLPEPRASGRRRLLSWHGATGLWISIGLLFLSATGLTWSQHAGGNVTELRSALSWETPVVSTELSGPARQGDVGYDRVLAAAHARDVTGAVEIVPPAGPGQAYGVQQTGRSWPSQQDAVAVDPASGAVVDVQRFADYPLAAKLARWGIDAHMGLLFGLPNQLVLVVLMGGLLTLIATGYRMWWSRPGSRAFGRPPERGAWRRVPGRVLAPIVVVVALVGYFLPMMGLSLLAFLLLDLLLGWRARRRAGIEEVAR